MTEVKFDFKKVPLSVFLDSLAGDQSAGAKVVSLALVNPHDFTMLDMPKIISHYVKATKELVDDIAIAGGSMQKFFAED